jgi:hypothetical protein
MAPGGEGSPPRPSGSSATCALHRTSIAAALLLGVLSACDKGCADAESVREVLGSRALGRELSLAATDCPDGLARCEQGVISVSRLATIPAPCPGSPESCRCPWDRTIDCPNGCAADGVEVPMERDAAVQLCMPQGGGLPALPSPAPPPAPSPCEEGDRFECRNGAIVDCAANVVLATCLRGCHREGGAIDDDRASRVAAFAILCSR